MRQSVAARKRKRRNVLLHPTRITNRRHPDEGELANLRHILCLGVDFLSSLGTSKHIWVRQVARKQHPATTTMTCHTTSHSVGA